MSSSSGPANAEARALLYTLCKVLLPQIQIALGQTINQENIHFEFEVDEFSKELEKFISGVISRSQSRSHDTAIEARLNRDSFYRSEECEETVGGNPDAKGVPEDFSTNQSTMQAYAMTVPQVILTGADEKVLATNLQILRKYVTQKMPIRLLNFEPHNSKLKISVIERTDIYNRLALKFQADPHPPMVRGNRLITSRWKPAQYAILSHTWNQKPGELTYCDWKNHSLDHAQAKCRKLVNFCKAAYEDHGLTLGWIDTVCINKESSAELDESIRSMYAWYRNAEVCITYLAGTKEIPEMHNDAWFTRGWTLQELVAPRFNMFYNMDWHQLSPMGTYGAKYRSIQAQITHATTITPDELQDFQKTPISRRMQLAAMRQVTREEDIAYCLMGIFDVSISTAYGEGADRAFFRLVEEIFRSTKDVSDIFNWAGDRDPYSRQPTTSLFPPHPTNYLNCSKQLFRWRPIEPLTLTHLGLRTPILLMPAVPILESVRTFPPPQPIGNYHADVSITPCTLPLPANYRLLDTRFFGSEGVYSLGQCGEKIVLTFGTLNVEEQGTSIRIPQACLAVLFKQQVSYSFSVPSDCEKVYTKEPIIFNLKETRNDFNVLSFIPMGDNHQIERSQLANHGMQLVTLYL